MADDDPFEGAPFLVLVSRDEIVDPRFRVRQDADGSRWREPSLREVLRKMFGAPITKGLDTDGSA